MFSVKKRNPSAYKFSSNYTFIILIVSFLVGFAGCGKNDMSTNSTGGTPGANEVLIQGMAFSPVSKTISAGTTLKWTNNDGIAHTVTSGVPGSPSGVFDSGSIATHGSFSHTFNQTGVFNYYCKIHTSMTATIIVQ
jgi:plastocyanin